MARSATKTKPKRRRKLPFAKGDPRNDRIAALEKVLNDGRPRSVVELNCIRRQLDDLKHGHKRGLYWDESEAQRAVAVFRMMRHPEGDVAGQPFVLEPWQEHCLVAPLFGWFRRKPKAEGGRRRFRRAYISFPRKNGKTALAAGLCHKLVAFDDEVAAHVYTLAGSAKQCRTLFDDFVKGLIRHSELEPFYELYDRTVVCPRLGASKIELLPAAADSAHSYNPHGFVLDEVHVQKSRKLWDTMKSGQGNKKNPLAIGISTAGHNRASICYELHADGCSVVDPHSPTTDDAYFVFITGIDQGDDWRDEETWRKANPNYGVTVFKEYFEDEVQGAARSPGQLNTFLQLNLNVWTEQAVRHFSMHEWDACIRDHDLDELIGHPCTGGFDAASTRDVCAAVFTFKLADDCLFWLPFFWAPLESIDERADRDRRDVKQWIERGHIKGLPGKAIDNIEVAEDLARLIEVTGCDALAFDPLANGRQVVRHCVDDFGVPNEIMHEFAQTYRMYNPVVVELDRLLADGRGFAHADDDCLRWMISNAAMKTDDRGNLMPSKKLSGDKIDGLSAGLMGLFPMLFPEPKNRQSDFYETHELEVI